MGAKDNMNINLTIKFDQAVLSLFERAVSLLSSISYKENMIMATLQDIVDDVASETTAIDSLSVFVKGLMDQIKALPGVTPAMQAQIDGIFMTVEKNKAAIVAAMAPGDVTPTPIVA